MAGRRRSLSLTHRQVDDLRGKFAAMCRDFPKMLEEHVKGTKPLTASQLKGIEIVLPRVLPTLQSVEQHVHTNPHAGLNEAELQARLAALIASSPQLMKALAAEQQRIADERAKIIEGETVDLPALTGLDQAPETSAESTA